MECSLNKRIQRLWRDVFGRYLLLLYEFFLYVDNEVQLWCLCYFFFQPVINSHLTNWKSAWVHHPLRSEKKKKTEHPCSWTAASLGNRINNKHTGVPGIIFMLLNYCYPKLDTKLLTTVIKTTYTSVGLGWPSHSCLFVCVIIVPH